MCFYRFIFDGAGGCNIGAPQMSYRLSFVIPPEGGIQFCAYRAKLVLFGFITQVVAFGVNWIPALIQPTKFCNFAGPGAGMTALCAGMTTRSPGPTLARVVPPNAFMPITMFFRVFLWGDDWLPRCKITLRWARPRQKTRLTRFSFAKAI